MNAKVLVALATLAGLGIGTPAASATAPVAVDCSFNVVAQVTVTGGQDTFTGAAYGHVAFAATAADTVSVRCWVSVDGVEVSSTPSGTGIGLASTGGQVTFTATDTQDVDLCADWSTSSESGTFCDETAPTQLPPQAVVDLLNDVVTTVRDVPDPTSDSFLCTVIPRGFYPPGIEVEEDDGDIYYDGVRVLDCGPFGDPASPSPMPSYWPTWLTDLP